MRCLSLEALPLQTVHRPTVFRLEAPSARINHAPARQTWEVTRALQEGACRPIQIDEAEDLGQTDLVAAALRFRARAQVVGGAGTRPVAAIGWRADPSRREHAVSARVAKRSPFDRRETFYVLLRNEPVGKRKRCRLPAGLLTCPDAACPSSRPLTACSRKIQPRCKGRRAAFDSISFSQAPPLQFLPGRAHPRV